ncbi:MAG: hypothetical protein KAQ64_03115 [Candidatus Pacebacteria bacterium]|nr:hypothetical protein [Candidatus Paceibacterota bacterium]
MKRNNFQGRKEEAEKLKKKLLEDITFEDAERILWGITMEDLLPEEFGMTEEKFQDLLEELGKIKVAGSALPFYENGLLELKGKIRDMEDELLEKKVEALFKLEKAQVKIQTLFE